MEAPSALRDAAQRRVERAELEKASIPTRVASNLVKVAAFADHPGEYYVLLGSTLSVASRASGSAPRCVEARVPGKSKPTNVYISSRSSALPPYRTAIGCTCPDWLIRGGLEFAPGECPELTAIKEGLGDILAAERRDEFRHAAQGCKHMMRTNMLVLKGAPVSLGASRRQADALRAHWLSTPRRKAGGPYEITGALPHEDRGDVINDEMVDF